MCYITRFAYYSESRDEMAWLQFFVLSRRWAESLAWLGQFTGSLCCDGMCVLVRAAQGSTSNIFITLMVTIFYW